MKRVVSLILVVAVLLSFPVIAEAAGRASYFFAQTSTFIEKKSGTTFEVWFDVTAVNMMDELGVSEIKVQRSSDGTSWSTMKTYSKSSYSELIDDNTVWHCGYVTYTGTTGYYYRAKVTFYAKNDSGSSQYVMYTPTVTVP